MRRYYLSNPRQIPQVGRVWFIRDRFYCHNDVFRFATKGSQKIYDRAWEESKELLKKWNRPCRICGEEVGYPGLSRAGKTCSDHRKKAAA